MTILLTRREINKKNRTIKTKHMLLIKEKNVYTTFKITSLIET